MKYYKPFSYEAVPEPNFHVEIDNRPAEALGEVVMKFEGLEAQLSAAIGYLLGSSSEVSQVVTSEMPFQLKLKVFAGLLRFVCPSANLEKLRELCAVCSEAEAKRNLAIHSRWEWVDDRNRLSRSKSTVKLKHGLSTQSEELHVYEIMDIGAYCSYAALQVVNYMAESFVTEALGGDA